MNALRVVVFVLAAIAVAVAANLILLGIASGPKDPVGKLTPRAGLVRLPPPPVATPATTTVTTLPTSTSTPTTTTASADRAGDGEGAARQADD